MTGLAPSTSYGWTLTYLSGAWLAQATVSATTKAVAAVGSFAGISAPTIVASSQNNVVVNYPAGTAPGDLLLLVVANNAQQHADFGASGNSTGWSAVASNSGYPPNQNGSVGQQELLVFWHVAGSETSASLRIHTSSGGAAAWVLDYKNVPSPAINGTTAFGTVASATTLTPGTFSTTSPNALVVAFAAITTSGSPLAPSLSSANGFTTRVATTASPGSRQIGLSVADEAVAAAGAVASPVWSEAAASQWIWITVAFT